ncbi:putative potassium transport system protein kup [Labeo rohita]|uniref:Potassium transport system protein kup n=1 Tax=Labeo rohita TaxID=84645 RepID=A0ABQ8MHP1_LABRO|nr:putative potassium transport system protein kup [Labeo rohita]
MTTEVVSLSAGLQVIGVAIWCVWAAHTFSGPSTCLDGGRRIPCLRLQPLPPLHRDTSVHQIRQAPSSLQLHLGQSSTIRHLGPPLLQLHLVPPALSGPSFPLAPPWSSVCSALALQTLCVTLACQLSISPSGSPTTCSAAVGRTPGVVSPSSTMAPPSVGRHHGCSLGPAWLLLLQVPHVSFLYYEILHKLKELHF